MHTYVLLIVFINFLSGGEGEELTCYEGATHDGRTSVVQSTMSDQEYPGMVCVTQYYRRTDRTNQQPIPDITTYGIYDMEPKTEGCVSIEQQEYPDTYHIKDCYCYTDLCNKPESLGRSVYTLEEPKTLTCAVGKSRDDFKLKTLPQDADGSLVCITSTPQTPDRETSYSMIYLNQLFIPVFQECWMGYQFNYFLWICQCSQDKCNVPTPTGSF